MAGLCAVPTQGGDEKTDEYDYESEDEQYNYITTGRLMLLCVHVHLSTCTLACYTVCQYTYTFCNIFYNIISIRELFYFCKINNRLYYNKKNFEVFFKPTKWHTLL